MISPYYNHAWPKRNFPFQRQYILKRRDYEKKEMNQLKDILWFNTEFSELTSQEMFLKYYRKFLERETAFQ